MGEGTKGEEGKRRKREVIKDEEEGRSEGGNKVVTYSYKSS